MKNVQIKREWLELMSELSGEEFKEIVLLIADFNYGIERECCLGALGRGVWSFVLNSLKRGKTVAQNGKKGGNPKLKRKGEKSKREGSTATCAGASERTELDGLFEEFWREYPRKVGKIMAKKSFANLNPNPSLLEEMKRAIAEQKQSEQWRCDRGRYVPHPSTWLNQGRWMDEVTDVGSESAFNSLDIGVSI